MKKKILSRIAIIIAAAVLFICIFAFLQALVMPKYTFSNLPEGALIAEYYEEENDHDILFVGDCEVYENYSPIVLWEEFGKTSYIRGSAQQLIWQSYYLMEEMLEKEKPSIVVYNVQSMRYNEPQSAEYNRLTLDGMKMSSTKMAAVKASMTEEESAITYVLPILRYHSRWSELTKDDFKYIFKDTEKISHNGLIMRTDIKSADRIPRSNIPDFITFGDNSMSYLQKMADLCEEKDVELVLVKAPTLPYWFPQWDEQIVDFAKENDVTYLNFVDIYGLDFSGTNGYIEYVSDTDAAVIIRGEEVSVSDLLSGTDLISESDLLDFTVDTYDQGSHLNLWGAEKLSRVFGRIVSEYFEFPDHSADAALNEDWAKKSERYYDMIADQKYELETYGYLKSYGAKKPDEPFVPKVSETDVTNTDVTGTDHR